MIIKCPKCKTQFTVPTGALPKAGRKVKCSKCAHLWLQKPVLVPKKKLNQAPTTRPTIPEGSNVPMVVPSRTLLLWFKGITAVASLVLFLSVMMYYQHMLPPLKGLYSAAGLHDTQGLTFTKTRVDHTRFSDKHEFRVETEIINESPYPKYVPPVHIMLFDKAGNEMGHFTHTVEGDLLRPGDSVYLAPEVNNVSDRANELVLDIGNSLDIQFR